MSALWFLPLLVGPRVFAQSCGHVQLQLTPDFGFAVGSSSGGSAYTFTLGGQTLASGPMTQLALFHFDNLLNSTSGTIPSTASGVVYDNGQFGRAVYLQSGGGITYPGTLFNVSEGTVEMWIAPRFNGSDPNFSTSGYCIFKFSASNGDFFTIAEDSAHQGRIVYTGGQVNGQWERAYNSPGGDITGWKAGEWHHVAATFSASANHIRFYLDGVKIADSDEGHFYAPSAARGSIVLGSTVFTVDELRISNVALSDSVIAFDAGRSSPFLDNEIYLPLAEVSAGQLTYSAGQCGTASVAYNGSVGPDTAPIMNPDPPSTLLPSGATSVTLNVDTPSATSCGYSVNIQAQYSAMKPFDQGQGATTHSAALPGLISDPSQVNTVYVRCASAPGYLLQLQYRAMPASQSAPFPRISDIGAGPVYQNGASYLSRYALQTDYRNTDGSIILQIHKASPTTLVLYWVNAVEDWSGSLPELYYLHDINGNRIQDWPGAYLLNMTNPVVGDYQANVFHTALVNSGLVFDGCFFDSFYFGESNSITNYQGQVMLVDANGDGKQDDQNALNAAWRAECST